jgi:hypothetical protein
MGADSRGEETADSAAAKKYAPRAKMPANGC